ncbi:MAG: hypothetical protein J7J76_05040 [Candidatus Latescibacteria bacterium]|nr:hypothetical protein [Candidatus Latescibacterota bacterium]
MECILAAPGRHGKWTFLGLFASDANTRAAEASLLRDERHWHGALRREEADCFPVVNHQSSILGNHVNYTHIFAISQSIFVTTAID